MYLEIPGHSLVARIDNSILTRLTSKCGSLNMFLMVLLVLDYAASTGLTHKSHFSQTSRNRQARELTNSGHSAFVS